MQDRSHPKSCAPKRMQSSSNRSVYGRSARSMASIDQAVEAQAMQLGVDHSIKHPTDDHAAQMHTSSSHVSSDPTPAHQQHFTMRQSFAKIVRENQGLVEEQEPNLDAWMHDPGAWGRRAPKADAVMIQPSTDAESCESSIRDCVVKSEKCTFSAIPQSWFQTPISSRQAVGYTLLDQLSLQ